MEERSDVFHRPKNHDDQPENGVSLFEPSCSPKNSNAIPTKPDYLSGSEGTSGYSSSILNKFSYINIRGLISQTIPSKVPYVKNELDGTSAIAFALTETWLNKSHLKAELRIDGYTIFRGDRMRNKSKSTRSSGGVAVYVRDDHALTADKLFSFSNGVIESLGILLPILNLVLIITYRSPDSKTAKVKNRSTVKEFREYLAKLKEFLASLPSPTPDIIMMGDFNLPHANWTTGQCRTGSTTDEQEIVTLLYKLAIDHFLIQQYDCPTHQAGNTIDLLFTNISNTIHNIESYPSSVSDHFLMTTSTLYNRANPVNENSDDLKDFNCKSFRSLNFFDESINWESLTDELANYDWCNEFRKRDVTEMMTSFSSVCLDISSKWVPSRVSSKKSGSKIPKQRRSLMRRRTHLKKQYTTARSECRKLSIMKQLIQIEKELQKSHFAHRADIETKAIDKIKVNSKFFYTFAKKNSKVKVGVGPLINTENKLIDSPQEIAEILSDQFSSVFSSPKYDNICADSLFPDNDTSNTPSLQNIHFSDYELAEAMNNLTANAAPGQDEFPAILLKKCSLALSSPLAKIWRTSLETGEIPNICKSATITPIHKGNSRAIPKNYRPVALTSHLIKVFEKVIRGRIVDYMNTHLLFNKTQHGFRGGHSCLSQLLNHFDKITSELEQGRGVDVIYLDFAKAFDKLDHGVTLNKLKSLGVSGQLGRWITNFLTNRTQSVLIEGRKSTPKQVISGVPQGSVLGPLLFLILMGDIDKDVAAAFLSSFADDTRVGNGIVTFTDTIRLQTDLNTIYKWSIDNNTSFNSDKFELLRYKSKNSKDVQSTTSYLSNNGSVIQEQTHVRDLGVTISNDATFTQHILERCELVKSKNFMDPSYFSIEKPYPHVDSLENINSMSSRVLQSALVSQ